MIYKYIIMYGVHGCAYVQAYQVIRLTLIIKGLHDFSTKIENWSHSEVKTSPRSFPISQSSVTAPTASVSSITSSEHSAQWDQKFFEVEYLKFYKKKPKIKQDIFYASLE